MAELEVDQSNLPRVQEVSQYFSVLEDGALAHNLQEQEIEQYYSSNIQRNQLVQKDIRVAKRLQNEEQERAQMLHEQATRQLEDQDSEYAHRIQEEIQRAAEEERRREEKDKEIAKRIQEEEDLYIRQRNSCRRTDGRVNGITIGSPNTLQPRQPLFREEEESARHSWVRSPSSSTSDYEAEHCEHRRPLNRDSTNSFEQRHQSVREQPLRRRSVQSRSSFASQSSTTRNLQGGWTDVVQLIKNDLNEQGYLSCSSEDELFEPVYKLERILSRRQQSSERHGVQGTRLSRHSSMREGNTRMWPGDQVSRMERYRHSDYKDSRSVRSASRPVRRYSSSDCKSGDRQRRVRFQEGNNFNTDGQRAFEENHVGKRNPRNCTVRPYQGNVSGDQRTSWGEINRPCRYEAKGVRTSLSQATREDEEYSGRFRERGSFEGGSCRVQTEHRPKAHSVRKEWWQEGRESRQYRELQSSRHARGEHWQGNQGDSSSTEEEEEMDREYERRREETRAPRQPRRSLSASFRGSSPGPGQSKNRPSLDLGELRQVLQDEELARKLQEEEEELLRRDLATSTCISYPQGDFTVAQVAQDEEIAHFMQKQEIKSTLRSRELEKYRDMSPVYDNREVYDGQMPRERRNSEGLVSPGNECSPEHRPPDPVTLTEQQNPFRNIAEELDPTFQRNEIVRSGPETLQMHPTSQTESSEEPAFVAPTKRQNDKPVRAKSKEKKDSKSKENCKQQ